MKSKVLIILFFLFTASIATAEQPLSYDSGICRFNLYDYELPPQFERAIVFGVTRILDTYRDTFGFSYPKNFRVKVTIFGNKEQFLKYQKKQGGSIVSEIGYYSGLYRETVVWIDKNVKKKKLLKETKRMVGVVFHEANHLMLNHQIPWCPSWINEGLSEYFDGMNVFGENRRVYLNKNRSWWCKHWLKKGFPITLREYISLNREQWTAFRGQDINAAYTIGYSLVYYLMSRKKTEIVLKELLWEFKRQGQGANSVQIIDKYYPGGFEKFERMWRKWIPRARSYRPLRALREATENDQKDFEQ